MDAQVFGTFIQTRRKELGMNQARLAEKLHVTAKAVSRWERGVGFPSIELLQPLAEALEISILELMQSRKVEAELSKEEASQIVTETIASIRTQERKQRRKIYFLFLLLPLVLGAQLFLLRIYYDLVNGFDSRWTQFLFYEIIFLGGILGVQAVYYVIKNEYSKLKEKTSIQKGLLSCLIVTIAVLFLIMAYSMWKWGEGATAAMFAVIALAVLTACYFYFLHGRKWDE